MRDIYSTLYRIGSEKAPLPFSEQTGKAALAASPTSFNLLSIIGFENMEFLQSLFMALFNRTMDDGAKKTWEAKKNLPKSVFQREAVIALLNSKEYNNPARRKIIISNNVYGDGHRYSAAVKNLSLKLRMKIVPKVKDLVKKALGI